MKMSITRAAFTVVISACITSLASDHADGQATVTTVQTNEPVVIGYQAERRGLFGLRTSYRPIVGTVPVQKTVTVQQVPAYVPPSFYVPTTVVVPQPGYLAPTPPTQVPVTTYYAPYYTPVYRGY
jgi:hypothetical protein